MESTSAFANILPSKDDFHLPKTNFYIKQISGTFQLSVFLHCLHFMGKKIETVWLSDLLKVIQEASSFLNPCTICNFRKLISSTLKSS